MSDVTLVAKALALFLLVAFAAWFAIGVVSAVWWSLKHDPRVRRWWIRKR